MTKKSKTKQAKKTDSLPETDKKLWQSVVQTVKPLGNRRPPAPLPAWRRPVIETHRPLPEAWQTGTSPAPDPRVDRRTKRRISAGHTRVDRAVDLHGMTQEQAFSVLSSAITGCVRRGDKILLVVTGKGGKRFSQLDDGPAAYRTRRDFNQFDGVLKRMVPLWLTESALRPYVQSYDTAGKEHGGDGALYVILRKRAPARQGRAV